MADGDPEDDDLELEVEPENPDDFEEEAEETVDTENPDNPEVPEAEAKPEVPEQRPERQPSRSESRIRALTQELRDRDQRIAETNRRIDALLSQQAKPQGETPEQRAQRFALLTPQEQIAETLRESEQRHAAQMTQVQHQMLDTADRTAFHTKASVDPLYAKWAPKVEGEIARLRTEGKGVPEREVLMAYLIGKTALERRGSKEGKMEVRQAQRRVNAQRTRPANSGSDTQAQRRQTGSLERRLENMQI